MASLTVDDRVVFYALQYLCLTITFDEAERDMAVDVLRKHLPLAQDDVYLFGPIVQAAAELIIAIDTAGIHTSAWSHARGEAARKLSRFALYQVGRMHEARASDDGVREGVADG